MSIQRRLAVGLAWMFAGSWAEQLTNLAVFITLARLLGPEALGLAAMSIVFVLFAEFLVRETIGETIIQMKSLEEGHLDAIFWLLGIFSMFVVVLIIIFADGIAALFSEPKIAEYVVWATPTVLFIGLSGVPVASLRRKLEFRMLAIRATIGVFVGGVVGIALAVWGFGVWSLIAQRVVQVFVNNLLAWIAFPWRPGWRATWRHFREVVGFGSKMVGLRASELVSLNMPTLVIGAYLGPVALGLYSVAWRLVETLSFVLTTPIRFVAQPTFAHIDRRVNKAGDLLRDIIGVASLVTFASFLGLAAVSRLVTKLFFGAEWVAAAPVLTVLSVVGVYLAIERLQLSFCIALGRAGRPLMFSILEGMVGVTAMVLVVERGIVGVAVAFAIGYYLIWPFRIRFVSHVADLKLLRYLSASFLPLINAIGMYLSVLAWQRFATPYLAEPMALITSILVGVAVYSGAVWLTMRERIRQARTFFRALRSPAQQGEMNEVDD